MKNEMPFLSVITPAYNRGDLLKTCYGSLCGQTVYDFEWIVVDDGSTDHTPEVMKRIADEDERFPVIYVRKENGGKHTALNASHPYIRGRYVLILDSDDRLTADAVETVRLEWKKYENDQEIGLLVFLRENLQHTLCAYAKDEYQPVDLLKYKRTCVLSSDCCEVMRAELFRKYAFPVYEGERFLAETALWYRLGLDKKCIYINKPIYICEYLEGGLTKSGRKMRIRNPLGGQYTSHLRMNPRCRPGERVRAALLFVCYGYFAGKKSGQILREGSPYRLLTALCLLPGKLMYISWRKKYWK